MSIVPFAATVGGWMGTTAAVGGATILAAGATAYQMLQKTKTPSLSMSTSSVKEPSVEETVPTEEEDIAQITKEQSAELSKRKKGTILTSSQGILTPINVNKKTLLGE